MSYLVSVVLVAVLMLTTCGCGGSGEASNPGTTTTEKLSDYILSFSYPSTSTHPSPWEAYSVTPVITYSKAISGLSFSIVSNETGQTYGGSVDVNTGKFSVSNTGSSIGCSTIQMKWNTTGETMLAQACVDKQYLDYGNGLSLLSGTANSFTATGFAISKSNPATMDLKLLLSYFDRPGPVLISGGGTIPGDAVINCSYVNATLPSNAKLVNVPNTGGTYGGVNYFESRIDWSTTPLGTYTADISCSIKAQGVTVSKVFSQNIQLVN